MTVNVFAGSRRMSLVIGVLWIVGVVIGNRNPFTPSISYTVEHPTENPKLVLTGSAGGHHYCSLLTNLRREWQENSVFEGQSVDVTVCFKFRTLNNWNYLPYTRDDGTAGAVALDRIYDDSLWNGDGITDPLDKLKFLAVRENGQKYIDRQVAFVKQELSSDSVRRILRDDLSKKESYRFKGYLVDVVQYGVVGLVVLYIVMVGIGWIVRGFLGIPKGMDFKPSPTTSDPKGST